MGVATQEQVNALFNIGGRRLTDKEYILKIDETLTNNVNDLLLRLGNDLVLKLEQLIPAGGTGALKSNIKVIGVKEYKGGYRLEIGFGADYNDFIDKGVRGIINRKKQFKNADGRFYQFKKFGMPPAALEGLKRWAKAKNMEIVATNKINKSEGKRKRLKQITLTTNQLAYYIKKNGIAGRNFKQRSLDAVMPEYRVELDSLGLDSLILKITK